MNLKEQEKTRALGLLSNQFVYCSVQTIILGNVAHRQRQS